MGPTQKPNVCRQLSRRALGFFSRDAGVVQRTNLGILRALVCQESTKFKNVWTTHSKSPIAYERGRIYFDNYRCCVSSVASEPRKLYEMPKCSKSEKIEDALLWECPVGEILPNPSDYKSSLIALTAHNWLFRISATTGKVLEKIYLASYCKFRYLSWDTPQEVIAVKSAQNKCSALARQAGIQQPVLLYLAVFHVLPFSLIGILEINKKIFGNVTDATLSHGILIVMYSSGLVRLYSFQAIIEQFMQQKLDLGEKNKNENLFTVTASGRVVKKNVNLLDDDPEQETFKIVDYEDELDLLSVVAVTQIDAEGKAHLDFHCNEYGTLLKSIPLVESWDVTYSHEVYFDRDLVLHIEQKPSRVFSCYVYQMVCDPGEEETTNRSCEKE
ncbi:DDB1- and CUL4-associated factor 17 isoform X2 [Suricata suricatta]|uniref:DDB1- and CUL4-associated factor 17 isoform X2 n=1 Tax=Suricata suricatta TaxID=37032 RepID=UPI001155D2A0|nr:DDB1- and CUL4-associated factor 17 isoform X2 [Suricata suricatta]